MKKTIDEIPWDETMLSEDDKDTLSKNAATLVRKNAVGGDDIEDAFD
jgi:hypothetical protein